MNGTSETRAKGEAQDAEGVVATPHPAGGPALEGALGTAEVAHLLAMDPYTVRRLVSSGRLPARRVGRRLKFFWSEVKAAISQHSTLN